MSNEPEPTGATPPTEEEAPDRDRRKVLVAIGAAAVGAAIGVPAVMAVRSCVPNALYESPRRFKAGTPDSFVDGATFLPEQRVFVVRDGKALRCMSAVCTHLGCTVQLLKIGGGPGDFELHCPCHGSQYHADGQNFAGPAPRPLPHHVVSIAPDDGQLVIDLSETADKKWRLHV